jgi:hypothetical protein
VVVVANGSGKCVCCGYWHVGCVIVRFAWQLLLRAQVSRVLLLCFGTKEEEKTNCFALELSTACLSCLRLARKNWAIEKNFSR